MITEVTLENFKSHRHTQLKFDDSRLHAIVGQNSSGKTSILQGVCYTFHGDKSALSSDKKVSLITIGCEGMRVSTQGKWKGSTWETSWVIEKKKREIVSSQFQMANDYIVPQRDAEYLVIPKSVQNIQAQVFDPLKGKLIFEFVAKALSSPSYSKDIKPQLSNDGTGLASTLDFLRSEYEEDFNKIEKMLISVVPDVRKIGLRRAKVAVGRERIIAVDDKSFSYDEKQELVGQEIVLDMKSGDRIPGHALSEGTILTLGLLTVLMSPQRPNLILLDDIQQGLHPKAQRELMTVIQDIIDTNPELQIIFTTHSPYIIDELKPSQVHILHSDADGFACHRRLDEHPEVDWALQTLTTGEFWGAEGEEWVASAQTQGTESETPATEAAETPPS